MPTLLGTLLVWAAAGVVDGGAPPDAGAPSTEPTALGASLHLPRPRLLPCERFQTVEVQVGEDVEHLSYDEGASIEWRATLSLLIMPRSIAGAAQAEDPLANFKRSALAVATIALARGAM